jgi:preprotein translocase subunit SecD
MLITLAIVIGTLIAFSGLGMIWGGGLSPKFALDLAGGTQIILTPNLASDEVITEEALDQAIAVIRQRVDASGVAEAEITKQGNQNIVVGIPGETPSDETIELISKAAQMRFRPTILSWAPLTDDTLTVTNQKTLDEYIDYLKSSTTSSSALTDEIEGALENNASTSSTPSDPSQLLSQIFQAANSHSTKTSSQNNSADRIIVTKDSGLSAYQGVWTDHLSGKVIQIVDETNTDEPQSDESNAGEGLLGKNTSDDDSSDSDAENATTATNDDQSQTDSTSSADDATASTNSYWAAQPLLTDETLSGDLAKDTPSGFQYLTPELEKQFKELDCTNTANLKGGGGDAADQALVTCAKDGVTKYLLGPVAVEGSGISQAASGLRQTSGGGFTNEWVVSLQLKDDDMEQFMQTADRIKKLDPPRNTFAIVLDGLVISAPSIQPDVTFQKGSGIEISGGSSNGFTQDQANTLANQLSFGALPLNFTVSSKEQVSASLGSEQLEKGLLAGLIGLLLVVIYSMIQYHALGSVTVGSLGVAAILTYLVILVLSWLQGYRLSLPGIIGIIVAIGITADSFIVYFERIRDEIRDGRPLQIAVSRAWHRAIRTIAASDAVNLLCAVVLYFLAVGGVRGFAFTLGLTTVIDFIVVILFTHPLVSLLSTKPFFFLGHPASGLNPARLGAPNAVNFAVAKHDWLEKQLSLTPPADESKDSDSESINKDNYIEEDYDYYDDTPKAKKPAKPAKDSGKTKAKAVDTGSSGGFFSKFKSKPAADQESDDLDSKPSAKSAGSSKTKTKSAASKTSTKPAPASKTKSKTKPKTAGFEPDSESNTDDYYFDDDDDQWEKERAAKKAEKARLKEEKRQAKARRKDQNPAESKLEDEERDDE